MSHVELASIFCEYSIITFFWIRTINIMKEGIGTFLIMSWSINLFYMENRIEGLCLLNGEVKSWHAPPPCVPHDSVYITS